MEQSLDDIALFLAIADAGGLAGAARATGQSPPTLSRRMTALERRLEKRLFERGKRGYSLTAAGRALLKEAEPLREAAAQLDRWSRGEHVPRVRITTGLWTARFLAQNIARVWSPGDGWIPEFLASNANIDIARREADIGVRNRRPEQSWLAGRQTSVIEYAIYGASPEVTGFLALPDGYPTTPSERWLRANHGDEVVTGASDTRLMLDLALSGVGRIVMPTYAGDVTPGLVRLGSPIAEITHGEWLVTHHDARHDRPVRAALDALAGLLTDKGLRPARA
ncbi:LysR family transcriptional regulator [Pseudoruegeria sp. HB172150]|uniref:LysR family transcriptional regulator n=1 Tax=Pseudoruegeria sp. HB172150 TaxID=2721164 RepID=UPI0015566929|nr:LysR family transcriptional regulator [Pseudoruegeria sp. HB172150]